MTHRSPRWLVGVLVLLVLSLLVGICGSHPAAAQLVNNQPSSPVASVVNCIRAGTDLGLPSDKSPRFAVACMGGAWDRPSYNYDLPSANGDAARTFPAVYAFGDGKPDAPGEPGHVPIAALGDNGSQAGDVGVGTVFGLAYSSGTNPAGAALAAATHPRLFMSAYQKRITRYGAGGPGAIYVHDQLTNVEQLYVQIPSVVPGPLGAPGNPGDGSSATWPSEALGEPYSSGMGGVHTGAHDEIGFPLVGKVGLGGLAMDSAEQYLLTLNLNTRTVYAINTWSATPTPQYPLVLPAAVAGCPGGAGDFRPFALQYQPDAAGTDYGYAGYVCSGETRQLRSDLRAGVLRWQVGVGGVSRVLDFALDAFDAQRGNQGNTIWQPWSAALYSTYPTERQQPLLTSLAFAEDGSMLLGLRSRVGDMGTTDNYPSAFTLGQGDLLRAPATGSGGWTAPTATGTEVYRDEDFGLLGPGAPKFYESLWGGMTYVPGTHAGNYGGEVLSTGILPYRNDTSGGFWFDLSGGYPTAREELYTQALTGQFKGAGLGDVALLCAWRAIGNRVWRDTNGNGVQDAGEPDIPGVRLQLLTTSGTVLATVTTGAVTGAGDLWRFYVSPFQPTTVRIDPAMFGAGQPLFGLSPTAAHQGADDALDSDADAAGAIAVPAGPSGQVDLRWDVGLVDGANLRVTKTGPATVLPGGDLSYTLVVTNDGPGIARGVTASDTLPPGVSYGSASPAPTSVSGQVVTWSLGDLADGASIPITLNATVGAATRGSVTNSVTVATTSSGDTLADNTSSATTTIITPNVWVTKSGTATVLPGGDLSYTLTYGNNGTAAAAGVSLVDTLPAGTAFVSASPAVAAQSGSTLTWNLGLVPVGGGGSITVVARTGAGLGGGTSLTNGVSISTTTLGDTPADNTSSATTTVIAPNVRVVKAGTATTLPGGLVDYALSYANTGTAAAAGVSLVDTLPPGVTFVSATPAPASQSGSTLTWNLGTLNAGAGGSIAVRVQVDAGLARGAVRTNTSSISTTTLGDDPSDNISSASTTVIAPNVQVTKTGKARVTAGESLLYTLSYANTGDAAAAGVSLVDTLPAGATFVSATPAPTSQSGSTLTWNLGTLAVGASGSIALVVQSDATLANGAVLTNGVSISTTTLGDVPTDNGSAWSTLVERADVAITKSSPTAFPAASGTTVTYYLDFANSGPALARSVVLTDPMPPQLTGVTWSCASGCAASGTGSVSLSLGDLAAGASGRIVVTGTAVTSVAREDFTNTATLTTTTPETATSNNTSSVLGAVWTSDLLLIKDAAPLAVAGSPFTATLTVRNQGPAPATSVVVTDTLPAGVTFVASTPAPASVSGNILTWAVGTLADQAQAVITLTLRADAGLDGGTSVVNTATTSGTADRDTTNNTSSATTRIQRQADLQIAKGGPARVTAGQPITYTLTYTNAGPSDARAVVLTDPLPSGVTFVSATPAPASVSGNILTWSLGSLTVGQGGVITITGSTDPIQYDPTITVVNQATITDGGTDQPGGGGSNTDPNPSDNTATATTAIETSEVLVVKTMPAFTVAGLAFDATVRVENRGPADAQGVTLRDFLPPPMALLGATPPVSVAPARWNLGTLAAGQVVTVTLHLRVPATTPRDTSFTNRVTVDSLTPDRDETNNLHEARTVVRPNADLRLVKDGPAGPLLSGTPVTYTLAWANAGPSLATAVVVTDTLPEGFTLASATPAATSAATGTLTWALGDQDVGATGVITVVGTLTTTLASAALANTAVIAAPTDEPNPGDNTSTVTTTVETVDLAVVKLGDPAGARAGLPYTYTLTIANAGAATATAVVVTDTLPVSLSYRSGTPVPTQSGQQLTWDVGTLRAGETRTLTLTALLAQAASGTLTNTATVGSPEPDRDPRTNTSTTTTPITVEADLTLVKDGPAGPLRSGDVVTYTLSYTNAGPALAAAVVLTDTLPPGFTLASATPAATSQTSSTLTWALGDQGAGATGVITVVGTLMGGTAVRTDRVNVAHGESLTTDPTPSDTTSTVTTTVLKPDLGVTKSDGVTTAEPGDLLTYAIVVQNTGLVTATGVVVTETPPVGGQVQPGDGWQAGASGTYTQPIPALDAGAVVTLTLRVQIPNPLPAGMTTVRNVVAVTDDGSAGPDPTPHDTVAQDDDALIWGTVGDLVWIDRNQNGVPDPGEPGLSMVPLDLINPDTLAVLARTTTDASGGYHFDGLRLGRYAIQLDPAAQTGALAAYHLTTTPIPVTALTAAQREDLSMDIGLHSPTSAVTLAYLKVERQADGTALLRWGTLDERATARFVVQRTTTAQRTADAVVVGTRASLGSAGGDYRLIDAGAPAPATGPVWYWLVEVETGGAEHVFGPATLTATTSDMAVLYLPAVRR
jgi:uncharacterized repeat protein (TIGR01451 family)